MSLIDSNHDDWGAFASLICLFLCSALIAGSLDVRAMLAASGQTTVEALHVPELDAGFHLLYELKFKEAGNQFEAWQKPHPADPLASASEAASYLFEECYRQGVLTSEFSWTTSALLARSLSNPTRNCARHSSRRSSGCAT